MIRLFFSCLLLTGLSFTSFSQTSSGFPFGATYADFAPTLIPKDTSAEAFVINEFAESRISDDDPSHLIFEYHARIRILKKSGLDRGNYEIILGRSSSGAEEIITKLKASTFVFENSNLQEFSVENKSIFLEKSGRSYNLKKVAFPKVTIGSIIEIQYTLESPFKFNWRRWEFQASIPKLKSEFWAHIPGNYVYNITQRGYLKLSKNEATLEKDCFDLGGGYKSDCAFFKWGMINIPAFKEEDYMTASSNFLSSINFELAEVKQFDGTSKKYTEEWKDADARLKEFDDFGKQIRAAKKIWGDRTKSIASVTDPIEKARAIYADVKTYFAWDEVFGMETENGVKKAFQTKKGNIADINLSLVGALQAAGLDASPALVSTRANGLPVTLHPVLSDFNYVIAAVRTPSQIIWLDATNPHYSFGFIPERCLNGQVRLIEKESSWVDLKVTDKDKTNTVVNLTSDEKGQLSGTIKVTYYGYAAFDQREKFRAAESPEKYVKDHANIGDFFTVEKFTHSSLDSLETPFVQWYTVSSTETNTPIVYYNPFLSSWKKNPFRLEERNYPVDFGAPVEETLLLTLDYSKGYSIDELPKPAGLTLPVGGGRYLFSATEISGKIQLTSTLNLTKSVYGAGEYKALRELFSRMVQAQTSQIVLKKK